jgi:hypothetical protein
MREGEKERRAEREKERKRERKMDIFILKLVIERKIFIF